jgi:hypothetical protein
MTRKARRGSIPSGSTVSVKQDPYSPTFLTNINTASKIMNTGDPRFGGRRRTRRKTRRRRVHPIFHKQSYWSML